MHAAPNTTTGCADLLRGRGLVIVLAVCAAFVAASALRAQAPQATPPSAPATQASEAVPAAETLPAAQPSEVGPAPAFSSPPVAIVPLDKSIPGAALSVAGPLQAWNGRAFITGSGSITAGSGTAQVTLPYRGTLQVCASSTVKLAADSSTPTGEVPGLLIALDHGAVEMSFAASTARERNADTLLTPYFRIMIGGPNAADVKVRLGEHGDTCVDNAGSERSLRRRDQRVRRRHLSRAAGPAGDVRAWQPGEGSGPGKGTVRVPAAAEVRANEFPLAQSEGLAPTRRRPLPPQTKPLELARQRQPWCTRAATTRRKRSQIPQPAASPAATRPATPAAQAAGAQKKPGFFRRIGRFFKRIFGAE